jgi:hypothetical protein
MKISIRLVVAGLFVAAGVASTAELGSVVSSFPTRGSSGAMTSGMAYVDGYLWTLQMDTRPVGASLVKRIHPTGSIVSSFKIATEQLIYEQLTHDGSDFWAGCCTWGYTDPRLLKIDGRTMSIVSSIPLNWFANEIEGLAWNGQDFWFSYFGAPNETYRIDTSGSVIASYPVRYDFAFGIAYAPALPGGPRVFECHDPGVGDTRVNVYKAAGHQSEYYFPIQRERSCRILCWDGEYLWVWENVMGNEYACRVVAWPPDIGVLPSSLGKVKALFR